MSAQIGRPVGIVRGWEYLQKIGYRPLVPRPQHCAADPDAQAAFKKKVARSGGRDTSQRPRPTGASIPVDGAGVDHG